MLSSFENDLKLDAKTFVNKLKKSNHGWGNPPPTKKRKKLLLNHKSDYQSQKDALLE